MFFCNDGFLGCIHAAHRGTVFVHFVPASNTLNKSNLLWYLPIRRPHYNACRRACGRENPFEFKACDDIWIHTISELLLLCCIIGVKTTRHDDAANLYPLFFRSFEIIYCFGLAEFFADPTSKAPSAIQAPFCFPLCFLLCKGLIDFLKTCPFCNRQGLDCYSGFFLHKGGNILYKFGLDRPSALSQIPSFEVSDD